MSRNKGLILAMAVVSLCVWLGQRTGAAQFSFDRLLSVADVEMVTGLKGVESVPQDYARMIVGDLNFAQPDGTLLLRVNFWDLKTFEMAKGGYPYPVDGLGDEAFEGPTGSVQHEELIFRKGDRAVVVASALDSKTNKPLVSGKPLRELARIIASRM